MAFQPVPLTAEFRYIYTYANVIDLQSTIYFRLSPAGWTATSLSQAAAALSSHWTANIAPLQQTDFKLVEIRSRDLNAAGGVEFIQAVGTNGTRAGLVSPLQVTAVVQLKAAGAGFPKRGWIFHPGALETDVNDVSLVAGYRTSVDNAYSNMEAAVNAVLPLAEQVIVSRFSGSSLVNQPNGEVILEPTPRASASTNHVTSVECRSLLGSQRDRRQ